MVDKYAFLSNGWIDAFQQQAQKLVDLAKLDDGVIFSYVEQLTDVEEGKDTGYRLEIKQGKASVLRGFDANVSSDCKVVMDYQAALQSMHFKSGPELSELSKDAAMAGKLSVEGDLQASPIPLNALHDAACDFTDLK